MNILEKILFALMAVGAIAGILVPSMLLHVNIDLAMLVFCICFLTELITVIALLVIDKVI